MPMRMPRRPDIRDVGERVLHNELEPTRRNYGEQHYANGAVDDHDDGEGIADDDDGDDADDDDDESTTDDDDDDHHHADDDADDG